MKRLLIALLVIVMLLSVTACSKQTEEIVSEPAQDNLESATEEPKAVPIPDWEYDQASKTLYVNVDMGGFKPDAPDFDGTSSNAPWAEYLPEIENIIVGEDVTFIGDYAFAFCSNLKTVEVGSNVEALDFRCFFKCGDFEHDSSIDMHFNSMPSFGDDVFGYTWDNPNVMIYVPDDMKEHWASYITQKGEMQLDGYDMSMMMTKDDVLFSNLMNPQELWSEGSGGFSENDGGEFGGGVKKDYNPDMQRLEIFGEDTGACAQFNTSIKTCMSDVGMEQVPQQAVIVKFSASDMKNGVRFSFNALDEISFSFRDDGIYFVDVANFYEMPISDYMPNNLELKNDVIYYFFFAFDAEGNIRMFIWEENMIDNQAYFEYDLYQDSDDINSSDIMMYLGVGANNQFNIYEYWVYTFDNYMEGMPYMINADNQNGDDNGGDDGGNNDYGPSWSINIAGNFDIMSDLVWQSIQGYALDVNGETFVGYNLGEMMAFSGNDFDTARVVFGDPVGSDLVVSPTSEAYIVFKKNDEFMGGPFLLFNNECMEYPVVQVLVD